MNFTLLPDNIENPGRVGKIPHFMIDLSLRSEVCQIDDDFMGYIVIKEADQAIKSIDLQLIRVESIETKRGRAKEPTEIQSLQVGEGDVRRGTPIPLFMTFPRQFSCPTTFYKKFRIEFEINVSVLFVDGFMVTKNIPIRIIR